MSRKGVKLLAILFISSASVAWAFTAEESASDEMTVAKMAAIIGQIDEDAQAGTNRITFAVGERELVLVYDESADRMRLMVPIAKASDLSDEALMRLMQANFDSALDARYAVAQGIVWGAFIHPLSSLTEKDFLLGIYQTVSVAETFGSSYSSGIMMFGGGDSGELDKKKLLDRLKDLAT
ncbi:MAG: hypothetical protein AAF465_07415 [Pseudomonadota bacterium]